MKRPYLLVGGLIVILFVVMRYALWNAEHLEQSRAPVGSESQPIAY